ncbi:MAG: hypothetical protein IPO78_00180 [Saprospiraceae bacterium]|nr:hypothetical protein [Saprospiraceae bacterium]MBK8450988.1 hypothetical protein [Saprospiraceae bacterium]MBK8485714.1 hypothetical protein [Saprospiraceae bacterium]MBK9222941.1 hypothetical protein [Saprospiraceae bacterium]MBK9720017.1 hypothetical protein [Saprospiraceae bacterium]
MKQILGVLFLLIVCKLSAYSQQSIQIHEDPKVSKIMDHYLRINRAITHISGWRITVITTTDRRLMEQTKTNFQQQFSHHTRWEYKEPYYYLKAGAFVSRAEATYTLETIKKKFPNAFLSVDNKISYEEF